METAGSVSASTALKLRSSFRAVSLSLPLSSVDLLVVNEIEGAGLSGVESLDHKAVMEELERTRKQIELDIKKEAKKKVVQILCDEE